MLRVYSAKQVGDLSYFVGDLNVLYNIILYQRIKQSNAKELNPRTHKKSNYVSFSRNMTSATGRSGNRWKYGIIVDGDRLSNKYHIEPFSFTGSALLKGKQLRIEYLVSYDDGYCRLKLLNWKPMEISRSTFNFLKNEIESLDEAFKQSHKLVYQDGGKRKVEGRYIDEKYTFRVKHGDSGQILSDVNRIPSDVIQKLTRDPDTNEQEERIWTDEDYIDIRSCIKGIILPRSELSDFETSQIPIVKMIREELDENYDFYDILMY